jgi:dimethylargininase
MIARGDLFMRVFDFNSAIVCTPGKSVINGLRENTSAVPRHEIVLRQHENYVAVLRELGLSVDVMPPREAFPDSMFVEDPALTFTEGAILLRPGAKSREAEREEMQPVLKRHFQKILELGAGDYVDGGDILVTPKEVFIGLSARTTQKGADALIAALRELGMNGRVGHTPKDVLHFKTASALLDEETILATQPMADSGVFADYRVLVAPAGEEAAANAVRINDTVLIGAHYTRTIDLLSKAGYRVKAVEMSEVAKLDAGLSCMSLRWFKA